MPSSSLIVTFTPTPLISIDVSALASSSSPTEGPASPNRLVPGNVRASRTMPSAGGIGTQSLMVQAHTAQWWVARFPAGHGIGVGSGG